MKVLAIIQCWDNQDQVRGFTVGWMEKLAEKVDQLIILTLEQRQPSTRPNIIIYSLGKENYQGLWRRIYYLYQWHRQVRKIIKDYSPQIIFTHMTPIYSVLAYPYAASKRIPIITWFLHPRTHFIVKLAHWLSAKVVSATPDSYPYKKDKLAALGHGIDTDLFRPGGQSDNPPMILSVGRISRVKSYETLLRAAQGLQVTIIGNPITDDDREYFSEIKKYQAEFLPALPRKELVGWYHKCFLHVNPTSPGSGDKVNLEAMACGRPALMATSAFADTLSGFEDKLIFRYQDEKDLADKVSYWLSLSAAEREKIGNVLRDRVVKNHSLDNLMSGLVNLFYENTLSG